MIDTIILICCTVGAIVSVVSVIGAWIDYRLCQHRDTAFRGMVFLMLAVLNIAGASHLLWK